MFDEVGDGLTSSSFFNRKELFLFIEIEVQKVLGDCWKIQIRGIFGILLPNEIADADDSAERIDDFFRDFGFDRWLAAKSIRDAPGQIREEAFSWEKQPAKISVKQVIILIIIIAILLDALKDVNERLDAKKITQPDTKNFLRMKGIAELNIVTAAVCENPDGLFSNIQESLTKTLLL